MTAYEHPSLATTVTPADRERAEAWLQEAYAEGRIDADEFDRRIGQVILANDRRELNSAFYGLVPVQPLAYRVPAVSNGQGGQALAAVAHFSAFISWIIGPALCYAVAARGSYAKREAAKAFNFQLIWSLAMVVLGIATGILFGDDNPVMAILGAVWVVLTVVGGVQAAKGRNWTNPVRRLVGWEVLSEK